MAERRAAKAPEKVDIQMTPMIDIVFQLMAFFLMTFKVAAVEGDFDLKLPKHDRRPSLQPARERVAVRLAADPSGDLAFLQIERSPPRSGRGPTSPFRMLREHLDRRSAEARAAGVDEPEVELDADDGLRYEHIVAAIEAIRGTPDPTKSANGRTLRFTPRGE